MADSRHITRRAALVGLAASAAAAPAVAVEQPSPIAALIEKHLAAKSAADELNNCYDAAIEAANLPPVRVQISRDYYTHEPRFAHSEKEIRDWAHRCFFGVGSEQRREAWIAKRLALLEQSCRDERAARVVAGLTDLLPLVDAADDAEYDAWAAVMVAKPQSMEDAATRARYLLSISDDPNDGRHRLAYWVEEYLNSYL